MRGYEVRNEVSRRYVDEFRIPMRGYELLISAAMSALLLVPNPHEGL